jgi:hypothetical protein
MATTLCSVDEVKEYLGQKGAVAEDDELITRFCERITKVFEGYCGVNTFFTASYTEYQNGNGTKYIFLNNIPVTSVSHLYEDPDWLFAEEYVSGTFIVVDARYIAMRDDLIPVGEQNVKIVYTAGYSTIPDDIKQVAIEEVARKFRRRKEGDLISKTVEGGSISYVRDELLRSTKDVLNRYRKVDII